MADDRETPLEQIAGATAVGITLLAGFGLLSVGYPYFWTAFAVGFAGLQPLSVRIARWYERRWSRARYIVRPNIQPIPPDNSSSSNVPRPRCPRIHIGMTKMDHPT